MKSQPRLRMCARGDSTALACLILGPTRLRANRTRLPPSRGVPALAPCWRIRPHGGPPVCRWWHQLSGWCSGGMCPRRGCHLPSAGPAPPLGRGLWARALRPGAPPPKGWGRPHLIPRRRTPVSISAVGVYVAIPRPRPRTHSSATDISSPIPPHYSVHCLCTDLYLYRCLPSFRASLHV